jgi:GMP synthase (glutamine-hydrolysing)
MTLDHRIVLDETDPEALPSLDEIGGILVMGGPMGARDFDEFPGLGLEAELIRLAFDDELPLFGVCLGHQIISTALGAKLHSAAAAEVGIGEVAVVADDGVFGSSGAHVPVLHWHHDVVELPDGAKLIASTDQTPNQAFRVGNQVFSTQFHHELDRRMLDSWLSVPEMAADLDPATLASIVTDFEAVASAMRLAASRAAADFAASVHARG